MKHLDFFRKLLRFSLFTFIVGLLLTGCSKNDEYEFSGTIIDARDCNSMRYPGYIVALEKPSDLGGQYVVGERTYTNAIMLFEPDRALYKGDHLHGSFYIDNKYSRANCSFHWNLNIPEGVFTSISVD